MSIDTAFFVTTDKEVHEAFYGKYNGIFRACANSVYVTCQNGDSYVVRVTLFVNGASNLLLSLGLQPLLYLPFDPVFPTAVVSQYTTGPY